MFCNGDIWKKKKNIYKTDRRKAKHLCNLSEYTIKRIFLSLSLSQNSYRFPPLRTNISTPRRSPPPPFVGKLLYRRSRRYFQVKGNISVAPTQPVPSLRWKIFAAVHASGRQRTRAILADSFGKPRTPRHSVSFLQPSRTDEKWSNDREDKVVSRETLFLLRAHRDAARAKTLAQRLI